MENLVKIAEDVLTSCLAVKTGEEVLIITDDSRKEIGEAIYEAAGNLGCEKLLMVMKEREVSGQEPPKAIAAAMKAADVVIVPTAQSLTHTNARIEAAKAGTRVATMPGITKEMFSRGAMTADYNEVEKLTAKVTEMLTRASRARIEKDGYVLNINISGRNGVPSPGVYREAGKCGNLPSGEAYIAPLEDGSDGEMIIDKYVLNGSEEYTVTDTFYFTLFRDEELKIPYEQFETKKLDLNDEAHGTVTFEKLPYGVYYLAETDADGKPVGDGFDYEVKIEKKQFTISETNKKETIRIDNCITPDNPGGKHTPKTGDDTLIWPYVTMMLAALVAGTGSIFGKRRRKRSSK